MMVISIVSVDYFKELTRIVAFRIKLRRRCEKNGPKIAP